MSLSKEEIENLFRDYKFIELQILKLEYQIDNSDSDNLKSMNYNGIKTSPTNSIPRPTENQAIHNIEVEERNSRLINKYKKLINIMDKSLELLPELQKGVIIKNIIEKKSFYVVCMELHISNSYAKKIKIKAVNNLLKYISDIDK